MLSTESCRSHIKNFSPVVFFSVDVDGVSVKISEGGTFSVTHKWHFLFMRLQLNGLAASVRLNETVCGTQTLIRDNELA